MMEVTKEGIKFDISKSGKRVKVEPSNVWQSAPEKDWEYVEIPKEDIHAYPYPKIIVNDDEFERGQRYLLPPILAQEVRSIMKAFENECLALLQPKKRMEVYAQLRQNGGTPVPTSVSAK